ncbi:FAD binding domain-containing protein, partial [Salmonella enterica]
VALAALQARVHVEGRGGARVIEFADFHRLPGDTPERDNLLADDELITAIELPPDHLASHSHYLKIRDRASYAFALVSVAAALELAGDTIVDARLA